MSTPIPEHNSIPAGASLRPTSPNLVPESNLQPAHTHAINTTAAEHATATMNTGATGSQTKQTLQKEDPQTGTHGQSFNRIAAIFILIILCVLSIKIFRTVQHDRIEHKQHNRVLRAHHQAGAQSGEKLPDLTVIDPNAIRLPAPEMHRADPKPYESQGITYYQSQDALPAPNCAMYWYTLDKLTVTTINSFKNNDELRCVYKEDTRLVHADSLTLTLNFSTHPQPNPYQTSTPAQRQKIGDFNTYYYTITTTLVTTPAAREIHMDVRDINNNTVTGICTIANTKGQTITKPTAGELQKCTSDLQKILTEYLNTKSFQTTPALPPAK